MPSWRDAARYSSDFFTSGAANVAWSGVKRGKGARLSWEGNSPENDLSSPPTFSIASGTQNRKHDRKRTELETEGKTERMTESERNAKQRARRNA